MLTRFERFSLSLFKIYRYWHKITADEMEKYELKGSHALYLVAMHRCTDGITATKLCELCGKDKSDVSRAMSVMEEKGLVTKEGSNQNFYRAILKLTDKGREAANHVCARARIAVEIAGNKISDEHRTALYETLDLISSSLQTICEEGLPQK